MQSRHLKSFLRNEGDKFLLDHAKTLAQQGRLLCLLDEMEVDASWKGFLYSLPQGTAKFILNASIDTLPTKSNLKLWGKRNNDRCRKCGWKETLNHILSSCEKSLNQGRFTYRHNQVLHELLPKIDEDKFHIFSDIEGYTTNGGGTIPGSILTVNVKPDVVLIDKIKKEIAIIELTCPWEDRLDISRKLKTDKYAPLVADLQFEAGYEVEFLPLEIGVRGIINKDNDGTLKRIIKYCKTGTTFKLLKSNLSKKAICASYYIFLSRDEMEWKHEALQ